MRDEESLSLRMVVLAIGVSVALALGWAGSPLWVWVGGSVLLGAGHAFSWRFRHLRSVARSVVVGVALLGALALIPYAIGLALNGDWLPVANFLLLFQGITSFELRSRGGLYASIGISGAIIFFVSQLALDVMFGVFLTGFTTLLLAFLAMSFLVDQARDAEIRWFRGRFSFAWFWTGVFITSMVVSAAIFMLMPKGFSDPITDAQGAVLPMRASGALQASQTLPDFASVASALPLTSSEESRENPEPGTSPQPASHQEGAASSAEAQGNAQNALRDGRGVEEEASQEGLQPRITGGTEGALADGSDYSATGNAVVMQVRSPVLSYWRANVFDEFDGETWHADPYAWVLQSRNAAREVYSAPQAAGTEERPLYPQTFFLKEGAPSGLVIAGYDPVAAAIPSSAEGIGGGSVYKVIAALPDLSAEALEMVAPASRLEYRYHQVPASLGEIRGVADRITSGAFDDLERTRRIVAFMDANYRFDDSATSQLAITSSTTEFLSGQSASGTSMDFATATVLLARASGIPSRLVTGYLPGRFDPLSGTYVVRASDQHAWAEIFLDGAGWVPFDSAPGQAASAFGEGGTFQSPRINALFSRGYGDEIYESLKSSPQWIADMLTRLLGEGVAVLISPVLGVTILTLGVVLVRKLAPLLRRQGRQPRYTRLTGDGRAEMLRLYHSAETMLEKAGVESRAPWQTLAEHTERAESSLGEVKPHLTWLRNVARMAAYDPVPYDPGLLAEARVHIRRLKAALKAHRQMRGQARV